MQKVLEDDYLLASIFGALPGSVLFIRPTRGLLYPPKVDNIAITSSLVSKQWSKVKAAQVNLTSQRCQPNL